MLFQAVMELRSGQKRPLAQLIDYIKFIAVKFMTVMTVIELWLEINSSSVIDRYLATV